MSSPDDRKIVCQRIREKYPGHLPVFIDRYAKCTLPEISKNKFLIPSNFTMGQVLFLIRKRIEIRPTEAIFVYVCTKKETLLAAGGDTIDNIYERYHDDDGLLYLKYSTENTFGGV